MSIRVQVLGMGGPSSAQVVLKLKATKGEAVLSIRQTANGDELIVKFPNGTIRVIAKD